MLNALDDNERFREAMRGRGTGVHVACEAIWAAGRLGHGLPRTFREVRVSEERSNENCEGRKVRSDEAPKMNCRK